MSAVGLPVSLSTVQRLVVLVFVLMIFAAVICVGVVRGPHKYGGLTSLKSPFQHHDALNQVSMQQKPHDNLQSQYTVSSREVLGHLDTDLEKHFVFREGRRRGLGSTASNLLPSLPLHSTHSLSGKVVVFLIAYLAGYGGCELLKRGMLQVSIWRGGWSRKG